MWHRNITLTSLLLLSTPITAGTLSNEYVALSSQCAQHTQDNKIDHCYNQAALNHDHPHSLWLFVQMKRTLHMTQSTSDGNKQLQQIDQLRQRINHYFIQHEEKIPTTERLDFRSVLDVYLPAIPTIKTYQAGDCSIYHSLLMNEGSQDNPPDDFWILSTKLLDTICPASL